MRPRIHRVDVDPASQARKPDSRSFNQERRKWILGMCSTSGKEGSDTGRIAMQSACSYPMNLLRRLSRLLPTSPTRRISPVALMQVSGIARVAVAIITRAWIASMGQPSPTTGFALAMMLELGACLLRLPCVRAGIDRSIRAMVLAVTAAIFHVAAGNRSQAASVPRPPGPGNSVKPPYCLPHPALAALPAPFIPLRPSCRQGNVQYPPRRAS